MTGMFTRLVAEIKFIRLYTCTRCGAQATGDTERMSVDKSGVTEFTLNAASLRPNPHHMPVEWGSFTDGIRCPKCIATPPEAV